MSKRINRIDVPQIGKKYHFFDDGKVSPSRHYIAKVEQIITFKEANNRLLESYKKPGVIRQLTVLWEEEKAEHDWIFADETDYFVLCSIKDYSEHMIWFVRAKGGGWFSMSIQSSMTDGVLDVSGEIYKSARDNFDENYWHGWYDAESDVEIINEE